MARQKGKVTTKPPGEPPPSKPKTRQWDVVDPSHIVEGHRSRTPSSHLLQSSDAKPVSKPATGSETVRIPSKPPPVRPSTAPKAATTTPSPTPAPGPVTTAALSMILEEQESQIETDADDEDLYVDHPSSSKARVARKVGKGASKAAVALPHTIKLSIPSHFGLKQLIWRTHHVKPTTTIANLKETIHLILGLDAIPAVKHPPLVMHIKHDPAKLCFALDTDNDWEALKDEWRKRAAKRGEDTCIEIVTGPKFFDFLEEAVAAHAASSKGKAKGRAKPAVNPFLPDNAAVESELHTPTVETWVKLSAAIVPTLRLPATCLPFSSASELGYLSLDIKSNTLKGSGHREPILFNLIQIIAVAAATPVPDSL
ncbi:hypothetical protein JB92DRAFT_3254643 [Gautieria morchelliformis]|nr:hypothetical protein JB92DRAFT_3254643 [Gautieria morchelliformis]